MPEVKITCAGCPYLIQNIDGGCHCMATSCPDEDEAVLHGLHKQEPKEILVFQLNCPLLPSVEQRYIDRWSNEIKEMRDKGIIILPNCIDFVGPVPNGDIKIINSEGEELCLEQKKL